VAGVVADGTTTTMTGTTGAGRPLDDDDYNDDEDRDGSLPHADDNADDDDDDDDDGVDGDMESVVGNIPSGGHHEDVGENDEGVDDRPR
jgi:hypothetical protein